MDCRTFNRKLEDYLEGGLDFPGRFGMERHAQQCFLCGKAVSDAQRLSRMARAVDRVKAPPDFEASLLARIQKDHLARRSRRFRPLGFFPGEGWAWRPVAWGALAVAILGAGIFFSTRWINNETDGAATVARKSRSSPAASQPDPGGLAAQPAVEQADVAAIPEPALLPQGRELQADAVFSVEESGLSIFAEPVAGTGYVEYLVPGPGDRQIIMRLPKTIRMRYGQPSEDYYIRNVSH